MPIGSEQPEVFEYTVKVRPGRGTEEETEKKEEWKERERKYDRQGTDRKRPGPASDVKQQTDDDDDDDDGE